MKERVLLRVLVLKKQTVAHLTMQELGRLLTGCGTVTLDTCHRDPDIMDDIRKPSDNTCLTNP